MKKEGKHFWKVAGIAALLPIVFAILDLIGANFWKTLGGWQGEAYAVGGPAYLGFFWTFAYILIVTVAIVYYLTTKDKSESLALVTIPYILLQFGVEDVFFYLFGNHSFWTAQMPWLTKNLWGPTLLGWLFGIPVITGAILFASAIIGCFIAFGVAEWLYKQKW